MIKPGEQADMFHQGTKSYYRVTVIEGPLTEEQVMGPDFYTPDEQADEAAGIELKRRLAEVTENMIGKMGV